MVTWREELVAEIHAELGAKPIIATLATVNGNAADARNVVIRQIHTDGTLRIVSDSRSQKNHQLKSNPSATAIIWFPHKRMQYRIAGNVQIISCNNDDGALRSAAWHELSDSSRALFHWPPCGQPFTQENEFTASVSAEAPVPDNFEVLLLCPRVVETLELGIHPHRRVRWEFTSDRWDAFSINP